MGWFKSDEKIEKLHQATIDIEYEILYNDKHFDPEEELQAGCLDPDGGGIYTDFSNFFNVIGPEGDRKNSDLENNDNKYSSFENRTATFSIEYDRSRISNIEQKISLFQFDQSTGEIMLEFDKTNIGKIDVLKVEVDKEEKERGIREEEEIKALKQAIVKLLDERGEKMTSSDIDAFLKHQNVDEVKELCEEMYHNGEISRTSNYRYFLLTDEKKKPKKAATKKSDPTVEIRKYAKLRDEGLITEEQYQAKTKELLGL
jgi:hypothetical protein